MGQKIATCCYCGARTTLVLDRGRHELACAKCGAPLHEMKALPKRNGAAQPSRPKARPMTLPRQEYGPDPAAKRQSRPKKRRKGLGRRLAEEIWDVVEDIFD
ncbi:hypothetical protein [uncultured Roseovarius sp.]|uniref:hypothetical protein n=1 Tax=uncultured Roseovarius sp. TaxID=293344 RepID=UPI002612E4E5|nr:hypothetical protein [uncultured Roseovarius sp.]